MAQTGLIGNSRRQSTYPNHKTVMEFSGERDLRDGQDELVVSFTSP
jgi:YidC/Oxa1 family membrane protein insertase